MVEFDDAIETLKNNGFDAKNTYPLIYRNNNEIGISYTFEDKLYGSLERVNKLENIDELDNFIKMYKWYKTYGNSKNVHLILNDYEEVSPVVKFIHNEKELTYEDMLNIDKLDEEVVLQMENSDEKRIIYEIERLFNYYNYVKDNISDYIISINKRTEQVRNSYKLLQERIDKYNQFDDERTYEETPLNIINFQPDINKYNELKDEFNNLKTKDTKYKTYTELLLKVWKLCLNLEINNTLIDSISIKNDLDNEQNILNNKLIFMEKLLNKKFILNGIKDLERNLLKIEKSYQKNQLPTTYKSDYKYNIIKKYSYFNDINIFNTAQYLNEASITSNYEELASTYKERIKVVLEDTLPNNIIVGELNLSFNKLTQNEQDVLTIFNSEYFNILKDVVMIDNYKIKSPTNLINELFKNDDFKISMGRCYNLISEILPYNSNNNVVRIFNHLNFTSPENFIKSIIKIIDDIKQISKKITLKYDLTGFYKTLDYQAKPKYLNIDLDIKNVLCDLQNENLRYVITKISKGTNVFYSNKEIIIPSNGENEIKVIDSINEKIKIYTPDTIIDKHEDVIKVNNYLGEVVRDASYSYVERMNVKEIFSFVNCEINKKM